MASDRTSSQEADILHKLVATGLTDIIKNGLIDPKTGEHIKAPASYYSAAIKFLVDNSVTGVISTSSPLKALLAQIEESELVKSLNTDRPVQH